MKAANPFSLALVAAALSLAPSHAVSPAEIDAEIERLDRALEMSADYESNHKLRMMTLENMLHSRGVSREQQYEIYGQMYDGYMAYQFDEAMSLLDKRMAIAEELADRKRMADVTLQRAMLSATSGMFFEASVLLTSALDTLSLGREQIVDYYNTQQRFYYDYNEYTQTPDMARISKAKVRYYRDRILECTPCHAETHQHIVIRDAMDAGDYESAYELNLKLLSQFDSGSHSYAVHAYDQAVICENLQLSDEKMLWYARSAAADVKCATKDNASLCCLAQAMLHEGQIDRAFRYITISLNDALFYNAKLRPWQIANVIPMIEKSYQDVRAEQERHTKTLLIVISVLATVLLGICLMVVYLYFRAHLSRRKIESMNAQIDQYNASLVEASERMRSVNIALVEANRVKEEYIGLFLTMCSSYIDKLDSYRRNVRRKLSAGKIDELKQESASSEMMTGELNGFYEMFDNAFLQLYPRFVEEFNELLKPGSRIELKKGERLNTELRIFALIRLGINDSSRIASLLRYSVNTIYNYRARIKNAASGNRDDFEERIKTIGAMK